MDKKLGRIAFEVWMDGSVRDEYWDEKPGYVRKHWESIAAAVAAEVRREMGWRPIAEAPEDMALFVGGWDGASEWCRDWPKSKGGATDEGYTHYLPQPEPPPQEPKS
jgi:hypothetical protein